MAYTSWDWASGEIHLPSRLYFFWCGLLFNRLLSSFAAIDPLCWIRQTLTWISAFPPSLPLLPAGMYLWRWFKRTFLSSPGTPPTMSAPKASSQPKQRSRSPHRDKTSPGCETIDKDSTSDEDAGRSPVARGTRRRKKR